MDAEGRDSDGVGFGQAAARHGGRREGAGDACRGFSRRHSRPLPACPWPPPSGRNLRYCADLSLARLEFRSGDRCMCGRPGPDLAALQCRGERRRYMGIAAMTLRLNGYPVSQYFNAALAALLEKGTDFQVLPTRPAKDNTFLAHRKPPTF